MGAIFFLFLLIFLGRKQRRDFSRMLFIPVSPGRGIEEEGDVFVDVIYLG